MHVICKIYLQLDLIKNFQKRCIQLLNMLVKDFLIEFTGTRLNPENEEVKVHMIAEVLAAEFPEFTFAFAEENFLRGYKLGLEDAYKTLARETEETESEE